MKTYEDLQDEVTVLRERLADLTSVNLSDRLRMLLGLTPQEGRVLAFLHGRPEARKEVIYTACFERDNGDGPDIKILDVVVCRIRAKLAPIGLPGGIDTQWGIGYSMSPLMRAWLDARLEGEDGTPTSQWARALTAATPSSRRAALAVLAGLIPEPATFRNIADRQEALGIAA